MQAPPVERHIEAELKIRLQTVPHQRRGWPHTPATQPPVHHGMVVQPQDAVLRTGECDKSIDLSAIVSQKASRHRILNVDGKFVSVAQIVFDSAGRVATVQTDRGTLVTTSPDASRFQLGMCEKCVNIEVHAVCEQSEVVQCLTSVTAGGESSSIPCRDGQRSGGKRR